MYGMKAVISKELARVFKDKKMIMSLFVMPVLLVVGIFALMGTLMQSNQDDIESHMPDILVVNAPESFVAFIQGADFITYEASVDSEAETQAIISGDRDLVAVFPDGFEGEVTKDVSKLGELSVPSVSIWYNPSEDYSSQARSVFGNIMEGYRQQLLGARFGDSSAVMVFDMQDEEYQDTQKAAGKMLGMMLPYFITMLIFAGAMGLGVDMIAGEKERGTMASMLLTPVKRQQIVLGKVIALAILAVMSASVYIISMVVVLPSYLKKLAGEDVVSSLSFTFTAGQIVQIVILMIGVVLMYVAVICLVSVFARTVKEASTYITPVYMVVLVAGMITMYSSADGVFYKYLIPVYGSSAAFKDILTQEMTMPNFLGATISTYLLSLVMVAIMTKAFNSEKVMFNA